MLFWAATAVLWLAASARLIIALRRPDRARVSLAVAVVFIALGITLSPTVGGDSFDALLRWPYGSELVQHLLFVMATFATLQFLLLLRRGELSHRWRSTQLALCTAVCLVMIALFVAAPIDAGTDSFIVEYADELAAVTYRAVFDLYVIYCLVGIIFLCLRNISMITADQQDKVNAPAETATATSLAMIAVGTSVAIVALLVALISMLIQYSNGQAIRWLGQVNVAAVAAASVLIGVGVLAPIPVEAMLRWRRAKRATAHLDQLWSGLIDAVPAVVLPAPPTRSPVNRAEVSLTRRRIEIADALHLIRVNPRIAKTIQVSADPPTALGHALRDPGSWAVSSGGGVVAAELLPPARTGELQQLLSIASGYNS